MSKLWMAAKVIRGFQLLIVDLAVSLIFGALIYDDQRRWPVVVLLVPIMVLINVSAIRRMQKGGPSLSLPIIYTSGTLFGAVWTIADFAWWKIIAIIVPLALALNSLQRYRMARSKNLDF